MSQIPRQYVAGFAKVIDQLAHALSRSGVYLKNRAAAGQAEPLFRQIHPGVFMVDFGDDPDDFPGGHAGNAGAVQRKRFRSADHQADHLGLKGIQRQRAAERSLLNVFPGSVDNHIVVVDILGFVIKNLFAAHGLRQGGFAAFAAADQNDLFHGSPRYVFVRAQTLKPSTSWQ